MTEIQRARDVLAKWRDEANPAGTQHGFWLEFTLDPRGRPLIETTGNLDLLNAVDDLLATAADFRAHLVPGFSPGPLIQHAERIAAAIISADERMSA